MNAMGPCPQGCGSIVAVADLCPLCVPVCRRCEQLRALPETIVGELISEVYRGGYTGGEPIYPVDVLRAVQEALDEFMRRWRERT